MSSEIIDEYIAYEDARIADEKRFIEEQEAQIADYLAQEEADAAASTAGQNAVIAYYIDSTLASEYLDSIATANKIYIDAATRSYVEPWTDERIPFYVRDSKSFNFNDDANEFRAHQLSFKKKNDIPLILPPDFTITRHPCIVRKIDDDPTKKCEWSKITCLRYKDRHIDHVNFVRLLRS